MAEAVVRLDKSKDFSECRGERAPDDPHYRVHFWQGQMVGKIMVLLPYDSEGVLVPEDPDPEHRKPYQGLVEGKPILHQPLYNQPMRDLAARKLGRLAAQTAGAAAAAAAEIEDAHEESPPRPEADDVNFASWLKGEATYPWPLLQKAYRARYHVVNPSKHEMVYDLVNDHNVVRGDQVCPALAEYVKEKVTA